jgi:hypothetical protein
MKLNLFFLSATALINAATAIDKVDLGEAGDYVILTKTGISTVPDSSITGDMGVSPIAATGMTGFALTMDSEDDLIFSTSVQLAGKAFAPDYSDTMKTELTTAVSAMETAYTNAAGRPNEDSKRINLGKGAIGGETLTPGVYTFDTDISITSEVEFKGNADDVFILQTTKNLLQAEGTKVTLSGGAVAKNVFWQVAGHVTVGAGSALEGILLVKTDASFKTGSSLVGRVFAQTRCDLQKASITEAL